MPIKVSSVSGNKIHYVDSKICIYCSNKTVPVKYKGGIASHFICTKCGIVQVDQSNPYLMSKDPQIYDRRKDTTPIRTKSGNDNDEIVIGRVKMEYKAPVDRIIYDSEIETTVKNPSQVSNAINSSLNKLSNMEKARERDTKLILREKFGRSVP
jgi:transcription initiation factor TFIIIB Brf1 subunit/transcription initiation factor TFIIB